MYCEKCGAANSETAKFCRKCGELVETEEETRVAVRRADEDDGPRESYSGLRPPLLSKEGSFFDAETQRPGDSGHEYLPPVQPTTPSAEAAATPSPTGGELERKVFSISPTLVFVKAGYVLAAVGALLLVAIVSAFLSSFISTWIAVLIGLLLFLIPAFYHCRQKLVRYTLTDSCLKIDSGFVSRTTRNVPIRRIQDVTVSATVPQRILGFGDIVIDNASDLGGKAVMKNINSPKHYADILLKQMRDIER